MNPTVLIARCTKPRHYLTRNGWSKKKEYLQIEGSPLIVTEVTGEFLTLNSLTSSSARRFQIPLEELTNDFDHGILDENKFITISMSEELLGGPYVVLLNDEKLHYTKFIRDENNISLNFKPDSTGQITIIGTTVIPEFSMFIPLIMGFMIILTVPLMRKFTLR